MEAETVSLRGKAQWGSRQRERERERERETERESLRLVLVGEVCGGRTVEGALLSMLSMLSVLHCCSVGLCLGAAVDLCPRPKLSSGGGSLASSLLAHCAPNDAMN